MCWFDEVRVPGDLESDMPYLFSPGLPIKARDPKWVLKSSSRKQPIGQLCEMIYRGSCFREEMDDWWDREVEKAGRVNGARI